MIRIGVHGASGRMGRSVVDLVRNQYAEHAEIAATVDRKSGGIDALAAVDAIIDFSLPAGTMTMVDWFEDQSGELPIYICGTTGLTDEQHTRLAGIGESTIVFHATNFSVGVAALSALLRFATPTLTALGYTPTIAEVHHVHKLDAPSGTAKTLSEVISPDDPDAIDITSIREGEVIGKHSVTFSGLADRIVIGHEASDRNLFARGAIEAALWLCQQEESCGNYTMEAYFQKRFLN